MSAASSDQRPRSAASTSKKVQVERFEREPLAGYVNSQTYATPDGLELLTQSGNATVVPWNQIKAVHFVRDFEPGSPALERRMFHNRPRSEGLWVRMVFRDRDLLEALLPNDLLQVQAHGFTAIPPDLNANTQRLFIPRLALAEIAVLGVIGSPLRQQATRRSKARPVDKDQIGLFE